jgi:hypothetical protein
MMANPSAITLNTLPNDCLLLVVDYVKDFMIDNTWDDKKPLINLSAVSKRIRALCLPKLFNLQHFDFCAMGPEEKIIRRLTTAAKAPFIPASLRLVHFDLYLNIPLILNSTLKAELMTYDPDGYTSFNDDKVKNTIDLFGKLIPVLDIAPRLHRLDLEELRFIDSNTRKSLRSASFPSVTELCLRQTVAANLLIKACPNLTALATDYPCLEKKKTLDALANSGVVSATFNGDGWKQDSVDCMFQFCRGLAETDDIDITKYVVKCSKLGLEGTIRGLITVRILSL